MEKARKFPYYGSLILLAYMPFHILLSQWLSTFTGGLEAWKVGKDVFTMILVCISIGLVLWTRKFSVKPYLWFVGLSFTYLFLHTGLYFLNKDTSLGVAALASVYNNRLLWFLIIGMSTALLTPREINWSKLTKFILVISTITVVIGLAQYLLPKDLMEHFGYSVERGVKPAFFIDDKPDLPRIFSTVRDPNSYGAFLIVPLTLLWSYLIDKRHQTERLLVLGLFGLHGLALFLTFSRGAWAGAFISLGLVTFLTQRQVITAWLKRFWPIVVVIAVVAFSGLYLLRDQYVVQNIIFHSDETTRAELDSNDLHFKFAEDGIREFTQNPWGDGPGTAGIVSIQNEEGGLLTENYFIQIAHEVGIAGLALFLMTLGMSVKWLSTKICYGTVLLATIAGYVAMSLLMHLWTNEVVALYWWLLAGVTIGCRLVKVPES